MTKLTVRTLTATGTVTLGDSPLGRGGEGAVYDVTHISGVSFPYPVVAKIYHKPTEEDRENKTWAMLKNPPTSAAVAWNVGELYTTQGGFVGFLMPKLEFSRYQTFSEVSSVVSRRKVAPQFTVLYAYTMIKNLAAAIESFHTAGHCVGDINESNALVGADATVMLVDADSAQIVDGSHRFPCTVGKPEYTAAELTHGSLRDSVRTVESDMFGFMVLAYQALTGGSHPTRAVYRGEGDPLDTVEKIRRNIYPALLPSSAPRGYSAPLVPVAAIPAGFRSLMIAGLNSDPKSRPSFPVVRETLEQIIGRLKQCERKPYHYFDSLEGSCSWCRVTGEHPELDVFAPQAPKPVVEQSRLPAVTFTEPADNDAPARRVSTKPAPKNTNPLVRPSGVTGSTPRKNTTQSAVPTGTPRNRASSSPHTSPGNHSKPPGGVLFPPERPVYKHKLVVVDGLGQQVQRPSLLKLLSAGRFGLVAQAVEAEFPQWCVPWWGRYSLAAPIIPLLVGVFIGFVMLVSLVPPVMSTILGQIPVQRFLSATTVDWVSAAPFFLGCAALLCLVVSALTWRIIRWRQAKPQGMSVAKTNWIWGVLYPIGVAVVWSVPMFFGVLLCVVWGLLWFLVDAFRHETGRRVH